LQKVYKSWQTVGKSSQSWQTVGKGSQKLANSWQKFPIVGKQLAKARVPDPVCTGATEVGNKSVSVPP